MTGDPYLAFRREIETGASRTAADALLAMTLGDYPGRDGERIERELLACVVNGPTETARLAMTCLGHNARLEGRVWSPEVLPVLWERRDDGADDALGDIWNWCDAPIPMTRRLQFRMFLRHGFGWREILILRRLHLRWRRRATGY